MPAGTSIHGRTESAAAESDFKAKAVLVAAVVVLVLVSRPPP